jgi:hypothetical protein
MKVAGVQMDIVWEDPEENFPRAREMAGEAAGEGARLIVLPEMFATGFSMNANLVAGFWEETRDFLSGLARELSVFVLGGYGEPADPRPANACSIFDPTGNEILHYRKMHPFSMAEEHLHYLAGEAVETVTVEEVRVTPLICYDLRFPEPFRLAAVDTPSSALVSPPASKSHREPGVCPGGEPGRVRRRVGLHRGFGTSGSHGGRGGGGRSRRRGGGSGRGRPHPGFGITGEVRFPSGSAPRDLPRAGIRRKVTRRPPHRNPSGLRSSMKDASTQ